MAIFLLSCASSRNYFSQFLATTFMNSKKVCNIGCHSSFCNPVFASKTAIFGITFLAGNNYSDSHHSQGGMKFATQISPLLNLANIFENSKYFRYSRRNLLKWLCLFLSLSLCLFFPFFVICLNFGIWFYTILNFRAVPNKIIFFIHRLTNGIKYCNGSGCHNQTSLAVYLLTT